MESDTDPLLQLATRAGAPANHPEPYAYLCEVIAERDAMRRQLAILRDGPGGRCRDSGMRLPPARTSQEACDMCSSLGVVHTSECYGWSKDRAFAEEMRR